MSELMQVSGIHIFAKLPAAVQQSSTFSIGIFEQSTQSEIVAAFIDFMRTPTVTTVLKRQGLDPIAS